MLKHISIPWLRESLTRNLAGRMPATPGRPEIGVPEDAALLGDSAP